MMKKTNFLFLMLGLAMFVVSSVILTQHGHHFTVKQITRLWAANWLGLIFLSEFIVRQLGGQPLLGWVFKSWRNFIVFFLVASLGGVMIEGIGQWLCKLWYYPFFNFQQYRHATFDGFALYMTTITAVYLAAKSVFDKLLRPPKLELTASRFEKRITPHFLWLGPLLIGLFLVLSFRQYDRVGGYFFNAIGPVNFHVSFWTLILAPTGIWLLLEYILYKRHEVTFLRSLIGRYHSPVLAIFASTLVVGISMELINLRYGYWVYTNWPWQATKLFNLPLVMISVGWPIQFVMWLSLLRVLAGKKSPQVWRA